MHRSVCPTFAAGIEKAGVAGNACGAFPLFRQGYSRRDVAWKITLFLILFLAVVKEGRSDIRQEEGKPAPRITHLSLAQLGDIEVTTASKEPVKVIRTPTAISVLTQDDIRRSGATSIPEVLRLVPGLEVARIDSDKWSLGVRGFGSRLSRSVLVLIDGRTVYTPLFAGVYWEVQDTLLADIERIEVIRGPGGTIWGANAVNAVINIITKSAKETHGTLVSAGSGNIDQVAAAFRFGGGTSEKFNYRIYGKTFIRGPEFHTDHSNFDQWRLGQVGFRSDGTVGAHHDAVTLQGDLYQEDAGQRLLISTLSPPYLANVQQNTELGGGNVMGRWRRVMGEGSDLELQAYYDRTSQRAANFRESRDTFDIDFIYHRALPRHQDFLWGLGARVSSGNVTQEVPTVVFMPGHLTDKLYSAFVQDEIPLVRDKLALTLGTKFLHNIYTGYEVQPNARLLWTPSPRQTGWAAVTRAVRTPSRIEEDLSLSGLLAPDPLTFYRLNGNRKFYSEQLIGYEAGFRRLVRPTFYLDIATFYNRYDNLLSVESGAPVTEAVPAPAHFVLPLLFRNGLRGATSGVEINPDWRPRRWWRLEGSYSYLRMNLKTKPGSLDASTVASTEGSSPHHQIVVQSFFDLPKRLELDFTYRYVSALPAQAVGSYETADMRLGWRPFARFELSLAGQNLLQPHHVEFGGDPGLLVGIKRSVYVMLQWQN